MLLSRFTLFCQLIENLYNHLFCLVTWPLLALFSHVSIYVLNFQANVPAILRHCVDCSDSLSNIGKIVSIFFTKDGRSNARLDGLVIYIDV
jgi:hypothetical protein